MSRHPRSTPVMQQSRWPTSISGPISARPGDGHLLVGGVEPECDPLEWVDDVDAVDPHATRSPVPSPGDARRTPYARAAGAEPAEWHRRRVRRRRRLDADLRPHPLTRLLRRDRDEWEPVQERTPRGQADGHPGRRGARRAATTTMTPLQLRLPRAGHTIDLPHSRGYGRLRRRAAQRDGLGRSEARAAGSPRRRGRRRTRFPDHADPQDSPMSPESVREWPRRDHRPRGRRTSRRPRRSRRDRPDRPEPGRCAAGSPPRGTPHAPGRGPPRAVPGRRRPRLPGVGRTAARRCWKTYRKRRSAPRAPAIGYALLPDRDLGASLRFHQFKERRPPQTLSGVAKVPRRSSREGNLPREVGLRPAGHPGQNWAAPTEGGVRDRATGG